MTGAVALAVMAAGAVVVESGRAGESGAPQALAAGPASVAATYDAPLWLEGGRLVVPVQVDGIDSLRFILDTAAESSAITRTLAERLSVDASRVRRMRVVGVGGARVMTSVALRTLAIGGATTGGVRAIVLERSALGDDFDGLLGNDVLRAYDVEIDVPAGRLRLGSIGARAADLAEAGVVLAMKEGRAGFVAFDATLSGSIVHAILDTGTPVSLLNWRAAALAGISPDTPGLRARRGGTAGLDGAATATYLHPFEGLAFGSTLFPRTTFRIADLPLFTVAGVAATPAMLVGVDLLRTCAVVLAYSTRTLHVCADPG